MGTNQYFQASFSGKLRRLISGHSIQANKTMCGVSQDRFVFFHMAVSKGVLRAGYWATFLDTEPLLVNHLGNKPQSKGPLTTLRSYLQLARSMKDPDKPAQVCLCYSSFLLGPLSDVIA